MKSLFLAVVCLFATFALVSCDDYGDNLYCSDKPCELARCECLEKTLDHLEDDYTYRSYKRWIKQYEDIVEENCDCIKKCDRKQMPWEREQCISKANEQLLCNWKSLNEQIVSGNSKAAADDILQLFQTARVTCVNREYKSCCEGESCNPFFQNATRICIEELFNTLSRSISKVEIKECLANGKQLYSDTLDKYNKCQEIQSSEKRSKCYQDEFDYAYGKCAEFKATMSLKVGQCTTASVITTIEQGLVTCNWDWLTKQQTKF